MDYFCSYPYFFRNLHSKIIIMSQQSLSLSELNSHVHDAIRTCLPETYWLRAETSDVRRNQNGHCYLEFVEKDAKTQAIIAKARGTIWSNVFQMLSVYFETETGQTFTSGLKVLVRVSVDFHELYGYSLTVVDIDPSFTVGDMARNRQLVLKQLEEEGVLSLNKELALPELATRIAVISSPTAAGYEDFCDQLENNSQGFAFYTKLFSAVMQGERSEASIIAALEKVFENQHLFDAVAIIRGGGATSDLNCFDSYLLATNCAQFPLPIISGIGHERNVTVIDTVAHTRAKTPTAVAEFLITHLSKTALQLIDLQNRLINESEGILISEKSHLLSLSKDTVYQSTMRLQKEKLHLQQVSETMKYSVRNRIQCLAHFFDNKQQYIEMISPENLLKRGYTITLRNGKIVKSATEFVENDLLETRFSDGSVWSEVKK
jgi:exodeoxyribonuclease VII large subunit